MPKKIALELFSGTGSFGKMASKLGYDVVSLDIDNKFSPTHHVDILEWDYKQYSPGHFDLIWASPCCTEYSTCLTTRPRNLDLADKLVQRTFDIIRYLSPRVWFVENPYTGMLRKRLFMKDAEKYLKVVDYCKYGYGYRKRTCIWTNRRVELRPLCNSQCRCKSMILNPHTNRWKHPRTFGTGPSVCSLDEKHSIPQPLLLELLKPSK